MSGWQALYVDCDMYQLHLLAGPAPVLDYLRPSQRHWVCRGNEPEGSNKLAASTSKDSTQATVTVRALKEASRSVRHTSTIFRVAQAYNAGR
jgi:hypothetical protein